VKSEVIKMAKKNKAPHPNAWKAQRFKGKNFTTNIERDLYIYREEVMKNCAMVAQNLIEAKYVQLIEQFYMHYSPKQYNRAGRDKKDGLYNTYIRHMKNAGSGVYVGGIRLSSEKMRDDYTMLVETDITTAGWALKDIVFDITVIQGDHGRPTNFKNVIDDPQYHFHPSPFEQIVDFRDKIVDDMNKGGDKYGIYSTAKKMATHKLKLAYK